MVQITGALQVDGEHWADDFIPETAPPCVPGIELTEGSGPHRAYCPQLLLSYTQAVKSGSGCPAFLSLLDSCSEEGWRYLASINEVLFYVLLLVPFINIHSGLCRRWPCRAYVSAHLMVTYGVSNSESFSKFVYILIFWTF